MEKEDRIGRRAYELWYLRGCLPGHDQDYWHQAYQEIEGRPRFHHTSDAEERGLKGNVAEEGSRPLGEGERKGWWNGAEWRPLD